MHIPVNFEFGGKQWVGELRQVAGGGSNAMFHLMVSQYYWGQLWFANEGWRLCTNNRPALEALAEDFGRVVEAAFG